MSSWVYRRPHTDWFYGRDRLIPLGGPLAVGGAVEAAKGFASFSGHVPEVQGGFGALLTQIPIELRSYIQRNDGVYRSGVQIHRRITILTETTAAGSDVNILAPAGVLVLTGFTPIFSRVFEVPLGLFAFSGLVPGLVTPTAHTRAPDERLVTAGVAARSGAAEDMVSG